MKIIAICEDLGIIWYTANDFRQRTYHYVIYGMQRKEFCDYESALKEFNECMNHAFGC